MLLLKLRALLRRRQLERDLDDELAFHLAMTRERRRFGNAASIREQCHDLWTFVWVENLWRDLRYAARQIRRSPGFAASAAVTLAVGIGATTAVYTMLATVLWRPVALPELRSLAFVYRATPGQAVPYAALPAADADDLRRQVKTIDHLAVWQLARHNVIDSGGEPLMVESARVSPNFFEMLRVAPALGRGFLPGEDVAGRDHVAVLSDTLWRRHFGGRTELVGRTVRIDAEDYVVVGVMPPEFRFPRSWRDLWVPLRKGDAGSVEAAGRLHPGQTFAAAGAELDAIAPRLPSAIREGDGKRRLAALPFKYYWNGPLLPILASLMLGAAVTVLLIACVNVANLQLARATGRAREVAVRVAMGSGGARLFRQLLTENLALAALGGALGLLIARWMLVILKAGVPVEMRHYMTGWEDIGLNAHAFTIALVATLGSSVLAGLGPAIRCLRVDLIESLKEGGHGSTEGRRRGRWRRVLVAGEIAISATLLVGSVLMVRGFHALSNSGASLRPDTMLAMRLALGGERYREPRQIAAFYRELVGRAAALPGVHSAVAATGLPYSRRYSNGQFSIPGREFRPGETPSATVEAVTPEYFAALYVPLRSGRLLTEADGPLAPPAALVSARAAERWWPGRDPVGQRIHYQDRDWSIVGVVGDIPYTALARELSPTLYFAFAQAPDAVMDIGLRVAGDPMQLAPAIRALVRSLDPELPITNLNTMRTMIGQESFAFAFLAGLMGVSGALALALSIVGVYGVTAYSVSARIHETGIRMALGASRGQVIGALFRRGMRNAAWGLAVGLLPAWGLARLMQASIWGVSTRDPAAFVGVPLALLAAAAIAISVPAVRATRVDPARALHHE